MNEKRKTYECLGSFTDSHDEQNLDRIGKAIDTFEYKLFTLTGPGHSSFSTPSSTAKRMISRFTSAFTSICLHLSHTIIIYYPLKHEDNTEFRGTPWDTCPPVKVRVWRQLPFDEKRVHCERRSRGHQGPPGVAAVPTSRHVTARHRRITAQVEGGGQRAVQVARQQ